MRFPVSVKEEVKPIWQDSAEKKKQAFTDMYLTTMDQTKGTKQCTCKLESCNVFSEKETAD